RRERGERVGRQPGARRGPEDAAEGDERHLLVGGRQRQRHHEGAAAGAERRRRRHRPRFLLPVVELVQAGGGLVGRLAGRAPHLAVGGIEHLVVGGEDEAGLERQPVLRRLSGVVLLPGVRVGVVRLGQAGLAERRLGPDAGGAAEDGGAAV